MSTPGKGIRVVIADDHPVVRKGLRMTLEEFGAEIELVGRPLMAQPQCGWWRKSNLTWFC